nr:MAG TPA: hypothetical protein [Crassvirales sp.]
MPSSLQINRIYYFFLMIYNYFQFVTLVALYLLVLQFHIISVARTISSLIFLLGRALVLASSLF